MGAAPCEHVYDGKAGNSSYETRRRAQTCPPSLFPGGSSYPGRCTCIERSPRKPRRQRCAPLPAPSRQHQERPHSPLPVPSHLRQRVQGFFYFKEAFLARRLFAALSEKRPFSRREPAMFKKDKSSSLSRAKKGQADNAVLIFATLFCNFGGHERFAATVCFPLSSFHLPVRNDKIQ